MVYEYKFIAWTNRVQIFPRYKTIFLIFFVFIFKGLLKKYLCFSVPGKGILALGNISYNKNLTIMK